MENLEWIAVSIAFTLYFMWRKFKYKSGYQESKKNCARKITETDIVEGPWKLVFIDHTKEKRNKTLLLKNQKENYICVKEPHFQPAGNKISTLVGEMEIGDWYHIHEAVDGHEDCSYFYFERLPQSQKREMRKETVPLTLSKQITQQ